MFKKISIMVLYISLMTFTSVSYSMDSLDNEISKTKNSIEKEKNFSSRRLLIKKLLNFHKKRFKEYDNNENVKWEFINDDLKYAKGRYAVHILLNQNDNKSILKLMQLNKERNEEKLALKTFTQNPIKSTIKKIVRKNVYKFSIDNIPELSQRLIKSSLSEEEKELLATLDKTYKPEKIETPSYKVIKTIPAQSSTPLNSKKQKKEPEVVKETQTLKTQPEPKLQEIENQEIIIEKDDEDLEKAKREAEELANREVQAMEAEAKAVANVVAKAEENK